MLRPPAIGSICYTYRPVGDTVHKEQKPGHFNRHHTVTVIIYIHTHTILAIVIATVQNISKSLKLKRQSQFLSLCHTFHAK